LFLHKSLQADLPEIFDELRRRGLTLSLDTNDDPEDRWDGVLDALLDRIDVLLPNEDEAKRIARKPTLDEALEVLARRVRGGGRAGAAGCTTCDGSADYGRADRHDRRRR
jgi:sugar/nucleoside kinase (ribokinase family)